MNPAWGRPRRIRGRPSSLDGLAVAMSKRKRRADLNLEDLSELALRVSQAVAEAEAEGTSGVLVAAMAFRCGRTVGEGGGVAFVYGRPRPFGLSLTTGFRGELSQLY